ncbi:MAG: DEAD/DEAH box helicase family protein [Alphaproteobacteria bacterium]|nr:DEAD/DEAH box helicase family protein [Alphaproteobacteria bacterium]
MQLKKYQVESLDILSKFLDDVKINGVAKSYEKYAVSNIFNQYAVTKYKPIIGLENTPYVCVRIPTGGGKTVLASNSIAVAKDYLQRDFPLVLWLVPSKIILNQTVEALKNKNHPYRESINKQFGNNVIVYNIDEYKQITKNDVVNNVCIVVSTIQKLKIKNKDGRKIYGDFEDYQDFFTSINNTDNLDMDSEKKRPVYSFVNICNIYRPMVIVDEAHNAIKPLSEELHRRINPSLILEFTATPKQRNNVLISVSAQTLKDENMIKMPIELYEYENSDWQKAVSGAISNRNLLQEVCNKKNEKIRPIVLYQAKNKDQDITPAILKRHLIENENIPAEKIAIATGEQRELDNINIFSSSCKIEHIITVQALKEGWDCSYAYIFCSLANIQSATDVEQLLGRVLRQPEAKSRQDFRLNQAYAHLPSGSFAETAKALKDKLIDMGFNEDEAEQAIKTPSKAELGDVPLFTEKKQIPVKKDFKLENLKSENLPVSLIEDDDGNKSIIFDKPGQLNEEDTNYIKSNVFVDEKDKNVSEIQERFIHQQIDILSLNHSRQSSLCAMGKKFKPIPNLEFDYGDGISEITAETLLYAIDWNPLNDDDNIGKLEIKQKGKKFVYDLNNEKIEFEYDGEYNYELDLNNTHWTKQALINWLDRNIILKPMHMLTTGVRHDFIEKNIDFNIQNGMSLQEIANNKYVFKNLLERILEKSKLKNIKDSFEKHLFSPNAELHTNNQSLFISQNYDILPSTRYKGAFKFKKHFFGNDRIDCLKSDGEEYECAMILDSLINIDFWVRNTVRKKYSFKLTLPSGDNYYPDFVAQLGNGKLLVVEYKGEPYLTNDDSGEKTRIGDLWAKTTNNIHIMVSKQKNMSIKEQIEFAIN